MKKFIANTAGAVGYLLVVLGWLWATVFLVTSVEFLENFTQNRQTESYSELTLPTMSIPDPVVVIVAIVVTVVMVGISVFAVYKIPAESIKQSSRVTKSSAENLTKLVERSKPLLVKKHQLLTRRLIVYIKLALAIIPTLIVAGLVLFTPNDMQLSPGLAMMITAGTSLLALVFFATQYLAARLLKVPTDKLV